MTTQENKISTSKFLEILKDSICKHENQEINIAINALRNNMINNADGDICFSHDDLLCFDNTISGYINIIKSKDINTGINQVTTLLNNQVESILIHFNILPSYDMMELAAVIAKNGANRTPMTLQFGHP
ncbi:hypothetical protein [Sulfurimonas sp.]|jgi:hypothetical protein|uniref:hypothetical protein n=1 Tax=Sulfurimonas sp. TaxID=2022749 RepID=UPI0025DF68CE|nr:hypothetical protein [Sulfurimonas sp.]MBT5935181.1 hypothetical protein [Sulfurimonas sp.]